jgi:hypothetical protein
MRILDPTPTGPVSVANLDDVGAWGVQIITNDIVLGESVHAVIRIESMVPEPVALSLLASGLAVLGARRRLCARTSTDRE